MTREEAIDCLAVMYERSREGKRVYHNKYQDAFDMAMDALEAQAERTEERTETHACDCISRQAAIEAHYEYCNKHPDAGFPVWSLKILENLPTIEPQRKRGMWIPQNLNKSDGMISTAVYYYPKCSVCGANANYTNFCPNCGADMREPEDIPMEYFESGGR